MTGLSRHLLRRLAPPIRPASAGPVAPPRLPLESLDFSALMQLAVRPGELGRPVAMGDELVLDPPLDDASLARLGRGADLAFEHGARCAALIMGGRVFAVDVHDRRLIAELTSHDGAPSLHSVDAAVFVPDQPEAGRVGPPRAVLPPTGISRASAAHES